MILNFANALTLTRIVAIPLIVAAFYLDQPTSAWVAFALFVYASITDYLDGWVARRYDQVTDFGRFLDPIADKLLIAAVIVMMIASGAIAGALVIAALLILLREVFVSGLREFLGTKSVGMPVSSLAKWKTAVQMVAFGLLLLSGAISGIATVAAVLLWLAAALTVYTGLDYVRRSAGALGRGTEPSTDRP